MELEHYGHDRTVDDNMLINCLIQNKKARLSADETCKFIALLMPMGIMQLHYANNGMQQ